MNRTVCIIPARMDSSRFPGKPLANLLGMPLVLHVWHRCLLCTAFERVVVATCDDEIRIVDMEIGESATGSLLVEIKVLTPGGSSANPLEGSTGHSPEASILNRGTKPRPARPESHTHRRHT